MAKLERTPTTAFGLERIEFPGGLEVERPVGVDLFYSAIGDPRLVESARQRRELYQGFRKIFKKVEDVNLDLGQAVEQGLLAADDLTLVYQQLSDFVEADPNHARIVLYLPFQFLPDLHRTANQGELAEAGERLAEICRQAWIRLLFESEVRASFVNGDVLEEALGEPERVRKAGHLTADFLQRGIIQTADVVDLLKISFDEELLESLTEGAVVAHERGLIAEENWEKILAMSKEKTASSTKEHRDCGLKATPERIRWEKEVERDRLIEKAAICLALEIREGRADIGDIEERDTAVGARGIFRALEALAVSDSKEAKKLVDKYQPLMQKLWGGDSLEAKDEIISGLGHLRALGLVDDEFINRFNVQVPDLGLPFPICLDQIASEAGYLLEKVRKIENDSELSENIYPLFLIFGSRVKGYAAFNADVDLAIFFRSGTPWEEREKILERLAEQVPETKDIKLVEYWLREEGGKLGFRQTPEEKSTVVGAPQIHFLIEGIWFGKTQDIKKIKDDIFSRYFDLGKFGDQKEQARTHLLRQIEMGVLQFRLLHKGFRRFYPSRREKGTEHSDLIDWESDYWDPGYRRIATQLFVSRVFLPDLSRGGSACL